MTRISRFRLKDDIYERIYDLFCDVLMHNKRKKDFKDLLSDLLTPTEQIMIAKRVALLFLLQRNLPQNLIAKKLRLSPSTVSYWALLKSKTNGINRTLSRIGKQKEIISLLEDVFADIFIQPGIKRGHWELYWQDQKRRRRKETGGI